MRIMSSRFGIINALMAIRHRFLLAASFLYLAVSEPDLDCARYAAAVLGHGRQANRRAPNLRCRCELRNPRRDRDSVSDRILSAALSLRSSPAFYALFGKNDRRGAMGQPSGNRAAVHRDLRHRPHSLETVRRRDGGGDRQFLSLLLWLSRETIIDYWLTSMVALAMWLLIRTNEFSNRKRAILFGVVCGLGMLTKWTFVFFVILPALWFARKNMKNAAIAAVVAAGDRRLLVCVCRAGAAAACCRSTPRSPSTKAIRAASASSAVVFYIRALEGSQLFLPLFVAFIAGLILLLFNFNRTWIPIVLWIAGGWLGLMLFQNKDPRYTAPLLPAVALITAQVFQRKEVLVVAAHASACSFSTIWFHSAFRNCRRPWFWQKAETDRFPATGISIRNVILVGGRRPAKIGRSSTFCRR